MPPLLSPQSHRKETEPWLCPSLRGQRRSRASLSISVPAVFPSPGSPGLLQESSTCAARAHGEQNSSKVSQRAAGAGNAAEGHGSPPVTEQREQTPVTSAEPRNTRGPGTTGARRAFGDKSHCPRRCHAWPIPRRKAMPKDERGSGSSAAPSPSGARSRAGHTEPGAAGHEPPRRHHPCAPGSAARGPPRPPRPLPRSAARGSRGSAGGGSEPAPPRRGLGRGRRSHWHGSTEPGGAPGCPGPGGSGSRRRPRRCFLSPLPYTGRAPGALRRCRKRRRGPAGSAGIRVDPGVRGV